jgi:hypothetical protein
VPGLSKVGGNPVIAVLFGVVHPEGAGWSFEKPIERNFDGETWTMVLTHSQFRVIVAPAPPLEVNTFKNEALEFVRGSLDALGFHIGAVLTPEITGGFIAPNQILIIDPLWRDVSQGEGGITPASALEPFVKASIENHSVRLALADLNSARDRPEDAPFYAYRAVECVRHHFDEGSRDRKAAWERMRNELGQEENELRWLKDHADTRRHGGVVEVDATTRLRAIRIANEVVKALVAYLRSSGPDQPT